MSDVIVVAVLVDATDIVLDTDIERAGSLPLVTGDAVHVVDVDDEAAVCACCNLDCFLAAAFVCHPQVRIHCSSFRWKKRAFLVNLLALVDGGDRV